MVPSRAAWEGPEALHWAASPFSHDIYSALKVYRE